MAENPYNLPTSHGDATVNLADRPKPAETSCLPVVIGSILGTKNVTLEQPLAII